MKLRAWVLSMALLGLAGCEVRVDTEEHVAREEKRFKVTGEADVHVSTFDGAIEIRSWDRDEVLVEIEKRAGDVETLDAMQVTAEQQDNRIEVTVRRATGDDGFQGIGVYISPRARLLVSVPRVVTLHARTDDGAIRADRLEGRIELRSSDGAIRAEQIKGELELETHDGSLTVDDLEGAAVLSTLDGGISVTGKIASLRAKTSDGSITVRAERGAEMSSEWSISTNDGSVAVYLPRDFGAEVDAETGDGRIRSELDLASAQEDARSRTLRGKLGAGGPLLHVRSGDGTISLREW
jgi:DUF4097 and DUF4098 domain-containing protein YvlB